MRISILLAATAALGLAACATHPTLQSRMDLLGPTALFTEPTTSARGPLVILISGCGGFQGPDGPNRIMEGYANAAAGAGAFAIVVDSFAPRGIDRDEAISTVCTGLQLRGTARAGDALAAEALAMARWGDRIDGVIVGGWSHGGWSVMEMLSAGPNARSLGNMKIDGDPASLDPDGVVLFYPYCGFLNDAARRKPWAFDGPLLLATAELDTIGPAKTCLPVIEAANSGLANVEHVDFPGMTHAFDEAAQSPGSAFIYDEESAGKARDLFARFVADRVEALRSTD